MASSKTFIEHVESCSEPPVGTILCLPSVTVAQIVGQSEGELVMIDMEHAPLTIDVVTQMVQAYATSSQGTKFPLIRIPSHGVEWVKWGLDCGAAGIIVPMVDDAAQMKAIIDRGVYPPGGRRSYGPIYAGFADPKGGTGLAAAARYFERARRGEIAIIPMIESKEGLQNVEEILSLDGVSGILVGPADLRLSIGLPAGLDGDETEFVDAIKKIVNAAKRLGKPVGTVALGKEIARKRAADGFDFLLSTFDFGALLSGLATDLKAARSGIQDAIAQK